MTIWQGSWIWTDRPAPERNAFVRFRGSFAYSVGPAILKVTADSRYVLYVNGAYLGQGPVRAWPEHWKYDVYDLSKLVHSGKNVLAVLVQSLGDGNFQYIPGPPGLLAQLEMDHAIIATDDSWKASPDPAFAPVVPRISPPQGFEEQYDARRAEAWTSPAYDDSAWPSALPIRPAEDAWHRDLRPREIPFLTAEPVSPVRLVSREITRSLHNIFTLNLKPYLLPNDRSACVCICHAYLAARIWAKSSTPVKILQPHPPTRCPIKINGRWTQDGRGHLQAGWNDLLLAARGRFRSLEFVVGIEGPEDLVFSTPKPKGPGDSPWALVGPFELGEEEQRRSLAAMDEKLLVAPPRDRTATAARGQAFWERGRFEPSDLSLPVDPIRTEHLPAVNVFAQAWTDQKLPVDAVLENPEAFASEMEWMTVHPVPGGGDVRLLFDFGREVVGFHRFEAAAPAGTILDVHNFEYIQPDGQCHFCEGMNNSFRYICREGHQSYQTYLRRGFRYSYLILRNLTRPIRLRGFRVLLATYPQGRSGAFDCDDGRLTRIWDVAAHTLRCCSEDTYTDCPSYEQALWTGDARNEALVDWVVNGDPRLWYRCLELAGESLDRSPIVESHVPSAWQNLLPAWSFLWMRSCREYLLFTGDFEKSRKLLAFVDRNVQGVVKHINARGLFQIRAWNMFDWAAMDVPDTGVVTHLNCFAVWALCDAAELARWLGEEGLADRWRRTADLLSNAVNRDCWNEATGAYTDCLHETRQSPVFSQQTQTVAYLSGMAKDSRAEGCRSIVHCPPEGFVRAGSPFFEFFLLEAYQREERDRDFLDLIRRDWGFMVDQGASTFWEMWSGAGAWTDPPGRLTRSYCHGWSAAPAFFLSTHVLGVYPEGPGFEPAAVLPHPGNLTHCSGRMPTPKGPVEVEWENDPQKPFLLRVQAPRSLNLTVRLPRPGRALVNGAPVKGECRETSPVHIG